MKVSKETILKLKIKGDDITHLTTALSKFVGNSKPVGFNNNLFTDDEYKLLSKLFDNLKP